jgi:YegS/Rv2252/BmrU family lipid kinase
MKKFKLIANPRAGRGKGNSLIPRILELLRGRGLEFDLEFTRAPLDAGRIARESLDGFDAIVAVGGDGTINEIIQGMVHSGKPLAVIPAGSGNDFIKSLRIPNNLEKAVDVLARGETRIIDAGAINSRYFVNAVGIGFDAAVNRASCGINHSKQGLLLYLFALLKTLGKFEPVPLSVSMNNERFTRELFLLTVGNGTTVGGGFKLTPHALLDDNLLDVTMVAPIGLLPLFWHLPKVFLGTIDRVTKYAVTARTSLLTVESAGDVPIHVDGEIVDGKERRWEIKVLPKALTVIGGD